MSATTPPLSPSPQSSHLITKEPFSIPKNPLHRFGLSALLAWKDLLDTDERKTIHRLIPKRSVSGCQGSYIPCLLRALRFGVILKSWNSIQAPVWRLQFIFHEFSWEFIKNMSGSRISLALGNLKKMFCWLRCFKKQTRSVISHWYSGQQSHSSCGLNDVINLMIDLFSLVW